MIRCVIAAFFLAWLIFPVAAAGRLDAAAINNADYRARPSSKTRIDPTIVKVEVLLSRARFSPGEIDGKLGENAQKALRAYAEANGLPTDKPLTLETWNKLTSASADPVITEYTISEKDVEGPFLKKLPAKMEAMAHLKALNYVSPREAIAEKFRMSQELLSALNHGKKFDRAGQKIFVTNVPDQTKLTVDRIEIDKSRQTVKAFDASGALIAFFPATVGSEEKPTPSGTLKVISADANPFYRYNPNYKFKGVKSKKPFKIAPGPNNPVGSFWIGLSAEGYGIHGTPDPSRISKSESHGCIRLTNWDANLLGASVKKGTPVVFIDEPQESKNGRAAPG